MSDVGAGVFAKRRVVPEDVVALSGNPVYALMELLVVLILCFI